MLRVSLIQLSSTDDVDDNFHIFTKLVHQSIESGATLITSPEVTNFLTQNNEYRLNNAVKDYTDRFIEFCINKCKKYNVWILIGSVVYEFSDEKCKNRSILIGPLGVHCHYDKIHMFDINLNPAAIFRESDFYEPGSNAVIANTPLGKIGMTVCYDVRFPELYQKLALEGAELITVPSAFTFITGEKHWYPLLKARAIETGSYIIAPAQVGLHRGTNRRSFGHSMIVDPDGSILNLPNEEIGYQLVEIDLEKVRECRRQIPNLKNRKQYTIQKI